MFKLVTIEETILVPAHLFGKPRLSALEHMVNKRFSDRVIPSVGLCVALWDLVRIGEDRLVTQTGESSTSCIFRLVVFRPFEGEILFSRINASHETGIFLELGFFDAVHVPKARLPRPCDWDPVEKVWIWRPSAGDDVDAADADVGVAQALYMDVSNECVFRVAECCFEDRAAVKPSERDAEAGTGAMWITGSLFDDVLEDNQGLGDPLWWFEGDAEDGGVEAGAAEGVRNDGEGYGDEEEYQEDAGDGAADEVYAGTWEEGQGEDEYGGDADGGGAGDDVMPEDQKMGTGADDGQCVAAGETVVKREVV